MRLTRVDMAELVEAALADLPEEFAQLLDNIAVVVEEEPSDEDLEGVGMDPNDPDRDELLGLYQGTPLTERDSFYSGIPDRVVIYSGPLGRITRSRREAIQEIRETVIHELGHYFGLDDDEMPY